MEKAIYEKTLESLNAVTEFSSELILMRLKDEKPSDSKVEEIRNHCARLAEADVFAFDTKCEDEKLFEQVLRFAKRFD